MQKQKIAKIENSHGWCEYVSDTYSLKYFHPCSNYFPSTSPTSHFFIVFTIMLIYLLAFQFALRSNEKRMYLKICAYYLQSEHDRNDGSQGIQGHAIRKAVCGLPK